MNEWIERALYEDELLDEIWHSSREAVFRTAYEIAKLLLEINDLAPRRCKIKPVNKDTYELYLAEFVAECRNHYKTFVVELNFSKIDRLGIIRTGRQRIYRIAKPESPEDEKYTKTIRANVLSMPKYPVTICSIHEKNTPYGEERWCIDVSVADYIRLDDELDMALSEYERRHGEIFGGWSKLADKLEEVWLENCFFNSLDRRKLRLIKKFAPKTHQALLRGLRAVERANEELGVGYLKLWAHEEAAWLGWNTDATGMSIRELLSILPERIRAVSLILRKLEEVYRMKIYYERDPLFGRSGIYIGPRAHRWIIAQWR